MFGGAFGLLVLSNLGSQRAANQIFPFVMLPQFFLAGVFNPINNLPPLLDIPCPPGADAVRDRPPARRLLRRAPGRRNRSPILGTAANVAIVLALTATFIVVGHDTVRPVGAQSLRERRAQRAGEAARCQHPAASLIMRAMASPSRRPVATERFLRQGRSQLFVREIGSGPPMVVLHGGPDLDHQYLLPEMDRLADAVRLVYYDQRGRGRSYSGEGAGDVTVVSEVADLEAVRASAGAGSVALLGHSFGCVLAMEYAIRHPGRVSHLVLMNTAPASHAGILALRRELAARRSPEQSARMRELAADESYLRGAPEPEAEYYRIHFGATLHRRAQLEAVVGRLRLGFTPAGIVAAREIEEVLYSQTWDRPEYDLLPSLRHLPIPALIIHGEHDFCATALARDIAEALPNGRLALLEDCGHFAYLEQPVAVRTLMLDFLASSPPTGGP